MLYCDRIEIIDINNTSASKDYDICHFSVFFKQRVQVSTICMNLSDISILNIKNADYRCTINGISKSEAIVLLQNIDLLEKKGTL